MGGWKVVHVQGLGNWQMVQVQQGLPVQRFCSLRLWEIWLQHRNFFRNFFAIFEVSSQFFAIG